MGALRFRRRGVGPALRICLISLLAVASLCAQSSMGSLRGIVADEQGAVIPGVLVSIAETDTSLVRSTFSNDAGQYAFPNLMPATYVLSAESPGFKKFERSGVTLATQQALTIDIAMLLGEVTQTVTVTEAVPLIESTNASQGTMLDRQKLVDLPNSGRNPFMMAMVVPGVVPVGNPRFNRMQDQSGSSQVSIAGGPVRGNNYLLDGVPITDSTNRAVIIPTIESVQEVKIQSNTYDAEMGRTGGGMYNTLLKSGSNQVHGSGFGIFRTTSLTANNFFNNRAGVERPDTPFRNWGASFGGPVYVPKVYDGKNKTFFWLGYEAYRQTTAEVQEFAVPTALERAGDFSQSYSGGALRTIYNPLSTYTDANGSLVRAPFAGNVIPTDQLSAVGLATSAYYPMPNLNVTGYGSRNYSSSAILNDRANQYTGKIDHEVAPWWRASISYLRYNSNEPGPPHFGAPASPTGSLLERHVDTTQIGSVFTVSPTAIVTARYGFNRFPNSSTNLARVDGFSAAALGFPSAYVSGRQVDGFPQFRMSSFADLGNGNSSEVRFYSKNFLASVAKFSGIHNFKFGFDFRSINQDFTNYTSQGVGEFNFNDDFSRRSPGVSDGSGSDLANLLLGFPSSGSVNQTTPLRTYVNYYALYFQDDIRVTPSLTVNAGIRYEYETGLRERDNNFTVGFDPNVINPISSDAFTAHGGLMFAGVGGAPTEQGSVSPYKFGPRAGFAWQVDPKTVIRGGYGLFWAPARFEQSAEGVGAIGYNQVTTYIASNDGGATPAASLANPYPDGFLQPVGNSEGLLTGIGTTIGYDNPDRRGGLVQQFSIDIQRELPGKVALRLAYIGSRSSRLTYGSTSHGRLNINQLSPEYFSMGNALLDSVDNPFYGLGGTGVIGAPTIAANQLLRAFPQFNDVRLYQGDHNTAQYDSVVIRAERRFSEGLTFLGSLTWSKNRDAAWGSSSSLTDSSVDGPQNAFDPAAEYGLALSDAPLRFVTTATYELPFGKGKAFASNGGWTDYLVGGWQINVISTLQSGFPLAIRQATNNNSVLGGALQRPDATGLSPETSGSLGDRIDNYINPAAFSTAPRFTFGNLSRTIGMRGPGIANFDISAFKTVTLSERFNAQFRIEGVNAFNTPQFRGPEIRLGNSSFGTISRQANFPRTIQLGVRLFF